MSLESWEGGKLVKRLKTGQATPEPGPCDSLMYKSS